MQAFVSGLSIGLLIVAFLTWWNAPSERHF